MSYIDEMAAEIVRLRKEREWRDISTAPKDGARWTVSSHGVVARNGLPVSTHRSDRGYVKVCMGGKTVSVHRLVALAFVENLHKYPEVNHIDGDKSNNRAVNLEWCTRSMNMKHAYAIGVHPGVSLAGEKSPNYGKRGRLHKQSIPVMSLCPDGSWKVYESINLVAEDGFKPCKVSMVLSGSRKSHGGRVWQPLPLPPPPEKEET